MTSHDGQSVSQSTIHLVKQTTNLPSQQTGQPDIQPSSHLSNLQVSQLATKVKQTAENKVCQSNQYQEKKVKQSNQRNKSKKVKQNQKATKVKQNKSAQTKAK